MPPLQHNNHCTPYQRSVSLTTLTPLGPTQTTALPYQQTILGHNVTFYRRSVPYHASTNLSLSIPGVAITAQTPQHSLLLTVNFRQPSHEFIFGVGMNFISYPLVLTPLV
jgi:hypothetical protein